MIWQDGLFAWPAVLTVVWLVLLLMVLDYTWRVTRIGGRQIALMMLALGGAGSALIWVLW